MPAKIAWKAITGDWDFIQSLQTAGTLLCLTEQERSTLMTFLQTAYWPTRWANAPTRDTLDAFISQLEGKLMEDCSLSLMQIGCTINLLLNGTIISTMPFDADACSLLGGSDGEGGGWYELVAQSEEVEDKKTELFSGAMALVEFCSEAVIDFFAAIDAEIELAKAAVVWMETVPGLDLSPAYEVLQACDSLNAMLRSAFIAADTPEWREQESCRIMCWCVENNYTFDRTVIDLWRAYLAGEGLVYPEQGYWQFVNVAEYRCLLNRFALGMNDEDEDWLILCDECLAPFGVVTFDDPLTDLNHTIPYGDVALIGNPGYGAQGAFWTDPPYSDGRKVVVRVDLESDVHVMAVKFDYNYKVFVGGEVRKQVRLYDSEELLLDTYDELEATPLQEWHTETADFDEADVRFVEIELRMMSDYTGTQWIYLDNIKVYQPES